MRNNPIFQVLTTKGNFTPLAYNQSIDDLQLGQIGLFSSDTKRAIVSTSIEPEVFLAVGVDRDGDGIKDDIMMSAGISIQAANLLDFTAKCYVPGKSKVIELSNMLSGPKGEYTMKFEFTSGSLLQLTGFQVPSKIYSVANVCGCGDGCVDDADKDCHVLPKLFYEAIMNDPDGLLTAEFRVDTEPDAILYEQYDQWIEQHPGECIKLRITSVSEKIYKYCGVNTQYGYPREVDFDVSFGGDFECSKVQVDVIQDTVYTEGLGYDINQLEYQAGGWNGNPGVYRASDTGVPPGPFSYLANPSEGYVQLILSYNVQSVSGFKNDYLNNTETIIAIPCSTPTTKTALLQLLNGWIETNSPKKLKTVTLPDNCCNYI